jgi:hypothetical protein
LKAALSNPAKAALAAEQLIPPHSHQQVSFLFQTHFKNLNSGTAYNGMKVIVLLESHS